MARYYASSGLGWHVKDVEQLRHLTNRDLVERLGYPGPETLRLINQVADDWLDGMAVLSCEAEALAVAAAFETMGGR